LHEIVRNLSDQLVEIVLVDRDKRGDVDHRVTWQLGSPRPAIRSFDGAAEMRHFAASRPR
jgi:hypothetical protein